ncbi:MAG TPA: SRPBCC family protein [Anaerolineales bacterium]|nr:SRPBCC family protein [Anaerolineales bacterium]
MAVQLQVSESIDRPVANVFHFFAEEHVRNHPRWDPFMQLEQVTNGPIGVGTIIKRINSRSGRPVEGTMEVVEFEPDRAIGMITHDGPVEIHGRVTFEAVGEDQTILTLHLEIPGMDESTGSMMTSAIQKGYKTIKQLIESEVNG